MRVRTPTGSLAKGARAQTTEEAEPERATARAVWTIRLVFSGAARAVQREPLRLSRGATILGRVAEDERGMNLDDPRTSRVHALIHHEPGHAPRVVDAQSRNGTFVNGRRVAQHELADGDVIRVGDSLLIVREQPDPLNDASISEILGSAPCTCMLRHRIHHVAPSGHAVLLLGESGTGKELAARALHAGSGRSGPLVAVNCAAIPATLAESQLFGHVAGAFTGASSHLGLFRAAHHGTLFLDEIGELPEALQPKLLRVVEERIVVPVGSVHGSPIDVRLVSATNRDLASAVDQGRFRGDLYARLAELTLTLPPLRSRREDILLLLGRAHDAAAPPLSAGLAEALLTYDWPFNVRELLKIGKELSVPCCDPAVIAERLRTAGRSAGPPAQEAAAPPERELICTLLREHQGNIAAVARALRSTRKQVYRWLEEQDVDLASYRGPSAST